ncbi:MAG: serine/threonine protein kinase, partial [Myxococcales bacterium]|nr:serine/threonine protein kinase [Myxococcales bacterium]
MARSVDTTPAADDAPAGGSSPPPTDGADDPAELRRDLVWSALTGTALAPRRFGHFTVHGVLGRGGMGLVLDAHDELLHRPVALKLLRRRDPGAPQRERLLQEARSLARLDDDHVVRVFEVGAVAGCPFIAMEKVDGQTLARWQQAQPRPWRRCVELYLQAGRGLAAAHAQGLVHRDFKPDNCIVDARGRVRVLDFGLALPEERGGALLATRPSEPDDPDPPSAAVTRVSGTLRYLAPEQLEGHPATASSDQFSFCVALFEALWGQAPFGGATLGERLAEIRRASAHGPATPERPRIPRRIPRWLREVVRRGLSYAPHQRFAGMPALLAALERGLGRRARVRALALGGGLVLGVAAVGLAWPGADPCGSAPARPWAARYDAIEPALADAALAEQWRAVAPRVEAYAQGWQDRRQQACEDRHHLHTLGEADYQRRLGCLDDRYRYVSALLDELRAHGAAGGGGLAQAVEGLPALEDCDRAQALRLGPGAPPPDLAAPVEALADQVAAAVISGQLGHQAAGLQRAERAVERAQALGWGPVHAQALAARGYLRRQLR